MKIAFNPSTVAALTSPPNNKDITFDLRGHNIFARGVKFQGTDTNTWRDIKINNVSIGSHTLDLRNGSNTTLTNTNGVVIINSTWRPVVDNLTSDSTTSSLSANQGRVLAGLINGKSDSDHNHDGRYVRAFGTSNDNIDSDWGQSFKTFDPVPSGTPPVQNTNISLLSIGDNFNRRKQLAFIYNSDDIYYRRHVNEGFSNWRRIAFANEIPTSLKNPASLNTFGVVYDGSVAKTVTTSNFISQVSEAMATITDGTMLITSYASNSGFADTNAINVPYKRKAVHLWEYIRGKTDSLYATKSHNHDGRYVYNYGGTAANGQTLNKNALFMSDTSGITGDWWHILQAAWNGEYRWNSQIAFPTQNRNGMYYRSGLDDNTKWGSWVKLLDTNNYSSTLDSRYYTESEVNSLLDAKLNRQNLSYGTWNPRGYNLAADYHYNGGDLSISENGGKMYVSIDGQFYQNEGRYRVLDTSDIGSIRGGLTLYQYLSATDANWYPLVWGGGDHKNTNNSTGSLYKSYDKLSWQTSTQTLYATNIRTKNIEYLSIGGGICWDPHVESASDISDAASITLVKSGVAGGTTLVLSQMNDANDTIQFKTNAAARLYHNSYPILTTQNTYVNNHKGYIYGAEITQVNNSDTVDGWHKDEINRTLFITSDISGLSSYWAKLWEIDLNNQCNDVTITFLAAASYYPSYFSIFSVYLRQTGSGTSKGINARLVELIGNIAVGDTELRLYVNNTTGNCQLWGNVKKQYGTMNLSVLKKAWRTNTDSSNIGTFFSTSFSSVQSLPGDGWYKVGVIQQGVVGAFNPASHTHTWTSITDKIVAGNEFNVVNAGYSSMFWFNYLPINDRNNKATISTYCMGNGKKGYASVTASGFIKNGGNEGQLLRADGGVAAFNWAGQSGQPTWLWGGNDFNSYYVYNPSNFRVAYAASAGNAETLGGMPKNYGQAPFNTIPCIGGNGVMEIGRYIDYHYDNSGKYDFSTRLQATGNYTNVVSLPSASGTLALINDINNYYWANVKISTSSSTTTSPTVHTLTATRVCAGHNPGIDNSISCSNWFRSSGNTGWYNTTYQGGWYMSDTSWIRAHNGVGIYTGGPIYAVGQIYAGSSISMGNIRLERTNEINSSNGLFINYRSSANVSLCNGGGNVGINTMSPTQKLDVNGNIITKGFGIQPCYLSRLHSLPTISPGDGHTYKCLEIGRTTDISCIIADKAGLMSERGILIKFNKGYDGQIILLKDLQNYGTGNGYFWVMPSECNIIKADDANILVGQNQISDIYDDGRSRFLIYSSVHSVWIEFYCG